MATIGSGTKSIANIVGTATWRPQDMDQSLAAFAEQLGGVAWGSGIPLIYGGNLDSTNFATGMALPARYLAQNKHWRSLTFTADRNPYSTTPVATYSIMSNAIDVHRIMFSVSGWSAAASVSGSVVVKVDGASIATLTPASMTSTVTRTGTPSFAAAVGFWKIGKGSRVEVDFSGLTCSGFSFYDRHVVLLGQGDNVE